VSVKRFSPGHKIFFGLVLLLFVPTMTLQAGDYAFPDTVNISAGRSLQPDPAGPADTLVVTVNLSNAETDSLRNLYYSDHLPVEFYDIDTRQIWVNGVELSDTAYLHEVGQPDEVFPGTKPHRWVIEAPPDSVGSRPCSHILDPSTGSLQIVYTARCTTNGQHCFPSYTWAGQLAGADDLEVFGYNDSVFIFISDLPQAVDDLSADKAGPNAHLYWSVPWDDVGIDHYVIFRGSAPEFTSQSGDSIAATVDTFFVDADGGVGDPGTNWFYLVQAVDLTGKGSEDSNCVGEFDIDLTNAK
jgi:hypothetical protein